MADVHITMSAKARAMLIPEIFHLILASLPMRCLLTTAPLVCRHWRDTIDASPTIQQKLFFSPLPETTCTRREEFQLNPLLEEIFPLWFQSQRFPADDGPSRRKVFDDLPIARHPVAFLRKGASWRKMLVQQPPTMVVGVIKMRIRPGRAGNSWTDFSKHKVNFDAWGGLRMGAFYDSVQRWLAVPQSSCQLFWCQRPPLDSTLLHSNEQAKDATIEMLQEVDVVLQLRIVHSSSMTTDRLNFNWWKKFGSEEFARDTIDF